MASANHSAGITGVALATLALLSATGCRGGTTMPVLPQAAISGAASPTGSSGSFRILYRFPPYGARMHGAVPRDLVVYRNVLYGTTGSGGSHRAGTVFSIDPSGANQRIVHSFSGPDGSVPASGLLLHDGLFYGTTAEGGAHGGGTVFSMTPGGRTRVLHSFRGGTDGATPETTPVYFDGKLYGTTTYGGRNESGTVYEITAAGGERVIHRFGAPNQAGASGPTGALTVLRGILYGTTQSSANGSGLLYALEPSGEYRSVHEFSALDEGPAAGGAIAANGSLYGATQGVDAQGHAHNGVIYAFAPPATYHVIARVGQWPYGEPSRRLTYLDGALYGVSPDGGAYRQGNVFRVELGGARRIVCSFTFEPDGRVPSALLAYNGAIFGTMAWGGHVPRGHGTIYRVTPLH